MKKNTIFFILTFVYLLTGQTFSQGFHSVFSKDGNDVIAVGDDYMFRSSDGGYSWISIQVPGLSMNSVYSINQKIWITSNPGASVYYSTNNGVNWTTVTLPGMPEAMGIFFTDENTGYVSGRNTIAKSTDGGATWALQTVPVPVRYNSVKFINSTTGVACGNIGTVITTTNGGTTWVQSTVPTTKNLLSLDKKVNTIISSAADGLVIKSNDRGASWSVINYNILSKSDVTGIAMIDANTYYSCGGGGFIRKSTDAGSTFQFQLNPMVANLSAIYFYDSNKGWAVSSLNRAIMKTSDGGTTWSFPAGTAVSFNWVQKLTASGNIGNDLCLHPANKRGIFCCCGSAIYRSLDIGETWTQVGTITFSGSAHSFYVSQRDTNLMLAAIGSAGGRIVRSTDYGQTWTSVWGPGSLTSYGMPIEVDPNHPDTVYLAPNSSAVMRSTNFGATWSAWGTTVFADPCDMAALSNNSNIVYMGDQNGGGKFYRSTDSGMNWTFMYNAGGSEIPMIGVSYQDNNIAYFTNWGGSGFRKTTDQGTTWNLVASVASTWGADVAKDDPTVSGFGTYGGGTFYLSTDGGASYIYQTIGGSVNYGVLLYDRGTMICQQGTGIFKLNTTYSVITGSNQISSNIPDKFELMQNYPNPFNPTTEIKYNVKEASNVNITLFDVNGREVETILNSFQNPGSYFVKFDGSRYASGIYFYTMKTNSFTNTKKMILIK